MYSQKSKFCFYVSLLRTYLFWCNLAKPVKVFFFFLLFVIFAITLSNSSDNSQETVISLFVYPGKQTVKTEAAINFYKASFFK